MKSGLWWFFSGPGVLEMLPANPGIDRKVTNNMLKIMYLSQNMQRENLTGDIAKI